MTKINEWFKNLDLEIIIIFIAIFILIILVLYILGKSNKIYAAMSKSIKDIVNGEFYLNGENDNKNKDIADSYKKQLEKDGFGAKDILTAYGLITQHAEAKYDLKNTYLHIIHNY